MQRVHATGGSARVQRTQKNQRFLSIVLVITLLVILFPNPVQAARLVKDKEFTGMLDAHLQIRMADAVVDLVRVRDEGNSIWVVAGFMIPGRTGMVYMPNGPWMSPQEIDADLNAQVVVYPYTFADPRARPEDYAYLKRLGSLFDSTDVLFWRISVIDVSFLHEGESYDY